MQYINFEKNILWTNKFFLSHYDLEAQILSYESKGAINYLRLTTLFIFSNKSSALILVYLFNWLQSLCPVIRETSAILQPLNKALVEKHNTEDLRYDYVDFELEYNYPLKLKGNPVNEYNKRLKQTTDNIKKNTYGE